VNKYIKKSNKIPYNITEDIWYLEDLELTLTAFLSYKYPSENRVRTLLDSYASNIRITLDPEEKEAHQRTSRK